MAVQNLLQAVVDITKVVFENKILIDLQGLVCETLVTTVLTTLHVADIVLTL